MGGVKARGGFGCARARARPALGRLSRGFFSPAGARARTLTAQATGSS